MFAVMFMEFHSSKSLNDIPDGWLLPIFLMSFGEINEGATKQSNRTLGMCSYDLLLFGTCKITQG